MKPLTAKAPHSAPTGPRTTSMRSMSSSSVSWRVPLHAGEERREEAPSVHHHGDLVGREHVHAADADGPAPRARLADVHAGGEPDRVRQVLRARPADVLAGDDVDAVRRRPPPLRLPRDGRDLELHQLVERQRGEIGHLGLRDGGLRPDLGRGQAAAKRQEDPRQGRTPSTPVRTDLELDLHRPPQCGARYHIAAHRLSHALVLVGRYPGLLLVNAQVGCPARTCSKLNRIGPPDPIRSCGPDHHIDRRTPSGCRQPGNGEPRHDARSSPCDPAPDGHPGRRPRGMQLQVPGAHADRPPGRRPRAKRVGSRPWPSRRRSARRAASRSWAPRR